jgi:hypothetical protein
MINLRIAALEYSIYVMKLNIYIQIVVYTMHSIGFYTCQCRKAYLDDSWFCNFLFLQDINNVAINASVTKTDTVFC